MGVEIGGVVGEGLNGQLLAFDNGAYKILLDDGEGLDGQGVHLIPEVLAGEGGRRKAHQFGEIGGLCPVDKGASAARGAGAGQDGGQEGFADGKAVPDLDTGRGERGVGPVGLIELVDKMVEGGDGAGTEIREGQGDGVPVLVQLQDVIDAPEVSEDADGRFTVLAKGLDDAEVANAVGLVGLQGSLGFTYGPCG